MLDYKKLLSGIVFFLKPRRWFNPIRNPRLAFRSILGILRHPTLFIITRNIEGGAGWHLGFLLFETALRTKHSSPNIVEVGAFKGLSTVYLAYGARTIGKRVKSFELFTGLPSVDPMIDIGFHIGDGASNPSEYERNLKTASVRDIVDLVIGDARETMLPTLGDDGFAVAFLDVDVYEVMKELLFQLWGIAKGGETIVVHDAQLLGISKAIMEFHTLSQGSVRETNFEGNTTSILHIPPDK